VETAISRATSLAADRVRGQTSLFDAFDAMEPEKPADVPIELLPDWPIAEKLQQEKELLGFYVSGHPLDPYAQLMRRYVVHRVVDLPEAPDRSTVRVGGLVGAVQLGASKRSGKPYALVTLEDLTGSVQLLAMNESYDKYRQHFLSGTALLVTGEVSNGEDRPKIFPSEILPLEDAPKRFTRQVHFRMPHASIDADMLQALRRLTEANSGSTPLFLCVEMPEGQRVFIEPNDRFRVTPTLELEMAVNELLGPQSYTANGDKTLPEATGRRWSKSDKNEK
jgi:DNA polymerase-3 subunit alpha